MTTRAMERNLDAVAWGGSDGSVTAAKRTRVAYVIGRYPAVSHAFITREVRALRASGAQVETVSIHRAGDDDALSGADREERRSTYALLPPRLGEVLRAHLRALRFPF